MLENHILANKKINKIHLQKKHLDNIHLFLAIFVLTWLNSGIYTYITEYISDILKLIAFGMWFLMACLKKKYFELVISKTWPLILFYILIFIYNYFLHNTTLQILMKNIQYLLIIYSIFLYYINRKYLKHQKIIITVLSLDIIYVGLNTIVRLNVDPLLSRILSTTTEIQEELFGMSSFKAVGRYGYFYGLVIVILFLFFSLIYKKKHKLLNIFLWSLSIYLLIKAQFTIAILFVFFFIILLLFSKISNKRNKIIINILLLTTLLMIYLFLPNILLSISNTNILPAEVSVRFRELADLFSGTQVIGTDIGFRFDLYTKSINAFCSNIVTGSLLGTGSIGGHSTWLDLMGLFGILSGLFFIFFIKAFRYSKMQFEDENSMFINIVWFYYLLLGIVNTTLFANIFIILFIFVPFSISIFGSRKVEKINEDFVDSKYFNR